MQEPLVSIIIPTYNSSSYIKRTLNSVLNQTYSNFEIIIIDDNSDDFNLLQNIIREYQDNRIIVKRMKNKVFAAGARNYGVSISNGYYIAYLDSDDEWYSDKLKKYIDIMSNYQEQDVVLYSAADVLLPGRIAIHPKRAIRIHERVATYKIIHMENIFTPTIFLRSSTAKKVKWNEDLHRNHEDFQYCLDLEKIGCKFVFINEPLSKIHWEVGMDKRKKRANYKYSLSFLNLNNNYFTKREIKYFIFDNVIIKLLLNKSFIEAMRLIIKEGLFIISLQRFPQFLVRYVKNLGIRVKH